MLLFTFLYSLAFGTGTLMCTPKRQCLGIMWSGSRMRKDFPKSPRSADTSFPLHPWVFWQRDLEVPFQLFSIHGASEERVVSNTFSSMKPGGLEVFIYCQVGMEEAIRQCWAGSQNLLEVILLRDITENGYECSWLCGQWAQKHGSAGLHWDQQGHTCVDMCSDKCLKGQHIPFQALWFVY